MVQMTDLSAIALLLAVVVIAAIIQGSIGFGFAYIVGPVLLWAVPQSMPVAILILSLPMTTVMAVRDRDALNTEGFGWILTGRLVGTALGVYILVIIPMEFLSVLLGSVLVAAVLGTARSRAIKLTRRVGVAVGFTSGAMTTVAGIGGPALSLAYQHRRGPELRSTLAVLFTIGALLSLGGLAMAGRVHGWHAVLAVQLLPGLVAGLWISSAAARWLDGRWLRPAVLTFAGVVGAIAIVEPLV